VSPGSKYNGVVVNTMTSVLSLGNGRGRKNESGVKAKKIIWSFVNVV
jgi:hypothetical protein